MKKALLAAVAMGTMFIACNQSVLNSQVSLATMEEDWESIATTKEYSPKVITYAKDMLAKDAMRKMLAQGIVDSSEISKVKFDKTYKEYLEKATVKVKKLDKQEADYNKSLKEMSTAVNAAVISKRNIKDYLQQNVELKVDFTNKSDKAIKGVEGYFEVFDMFDNPVVRLNIAHTSAIKPSATSQAKFYWDTIFSQELEKLAATDLSKLRIEWEPHKVLFQDGSKIVAPQKPKSELFSEM